MSIDQFETRPLDEWFRETVAGDIALCDPFSGVPLNYDPMTRQSHISHEPKHPTTAFTNDFELGNGYGYWQGSKYAGNIAVAVLLTDPTSKHGLGDYDTFKDIVSGFDYVGYANTQSVRAGEIRRRNVPLLGSMTASGEVVTDDTYMSTIMDVAGQHGKPLFNFDPSADIFGQPDTAASRGLQSVRDAVTGQGIDQKDPNDPDLTYLATDYVYANTLQWHGVMSAGVKVEGLQREYKGQGESVLLLVPAEHGDTGRKLAVSGVQNIMAEYARPEYRSDTTNGSYAFALDRGHIPKAQLRGAKR